MNPEPSPALQGDSDPSKSVSSVGLSDGSQVCPTTTPERHLLGEFSMTCYACHVEADS